MAGVSLHFRRLRTKFRFLGSVKSIFSVALFPDIGFGTWNFTSKEDLNRRKQVFLLNFKPWPAQKPKIWSVFYEELV